MKAARSGKIPSAAAEDCRHAVSQCMPEPPLVRMQSAVLIDASRSPGKGRGPIDRAIAIIKVLRGGRTGEPAKIIAHQLAQRSSSRETGRGASVQLPRVASVNRVTRTKIGTT